MRRRRNDRLLFAVLGPRGDRVSQVLPEHAFEARHFARLVEPTEQIVEGAVCEYHEDDMVKGVGSTDRHDTSLTGPEATSRAWVEVTSASTA